MEFIKNFSNVFIILLFKYNIRNSCQSVCQNVSEAQWELLGWYYGDCNYVKVVIIYDKIYDYDVDDYMESFISQFYNKLPIPLQVQTFDVSFEEPNYVLTELYSWQGTELPVRSTQNSARIVFNVKEKFHPGKPDEANFGIFVITKSAEILSQFVYGIARRPFHTPRGKYILAIIENINTIWIEKVGEILERLWRNYALLRTLAYSSCNDDEIYYHEAFVLKENSNINVTSYDRWGQLKTTTIKNKHFDNEWLIERPRQFNGYPITAVMFQRDPTALYWKTLPENFVNSYFCDVRNLSKTYGGFDGLVYGNLMKFLNFSSDIIPPNMKQEYGWKADNGSFTGSIGDILYSRAAISFNGRFITEYETTEIEFAFPIYFDKMCIIAPKALKVPQWVAIFKCYDPHCWALIVVMNTVLGYIWYLFKKWAMYKARHNILFRKENEKVSAEYNKCYVTIIEMWVIMTCGAASRLPYRTVERIFMTSCLMLNIIIGGTFQGSLTTSYSTTTYYKDIDTLEDLDKSGLAIGTSSKSLMGIFGETKTPLMISLQKKLILMKTAAIDQAAYERDICCTERASDIRIIIVKYYEQPDGSVLLHLVKECPRSYYLGYIVRKGWPFLVRFNNVLMYLIEAGLTNAWYDQTVHAILFRERVNRVRNLQVETEAFNLTDMQTPFYMLLFGIFISAFVFVTELAIYHYKKSRIYEVAYTE